MKTILSDLTKCGIPSFKFAGFQFPRHVARIQSGTLAQRLNARKTTCCSEYYHAPKPGAKSRGFYLSRRPFGLRFDYVANAEFYSDNEQHDTIQGIVLILPKSRGYLAGYTMGMGMSSGVDYEIFTDGNDAADCARSMAENAAESQREDSARFNAMQRAEFDAESARETAEHAIQARNVSDWHRENARDSIDALRAARESLQDATRAYERG